jgi:hypothetical protein
MPLFHDEAPKRHITEDEWRLYESYNAILNDLEDALTGQRLLDLPIVQTYADIITAVHIRIQVVEKECLIKETEEEAAKREAEEEAERQRQEEEQRRQEEEQRQFEKYS